MGTAIVVAIVSGIVSLVSVAANAFITSLNLRAESKRAREAREAEDQRTRENREAEAARRAEEQDAAAARNAADSRRVVVDARWVAVHAVLEAEERLGYQDFFIYAAAVQRLSMLTHQDESALRTALAHRAGAERRNGDALNPQWWHPWVTEWATHPDEAMAGATSDVGTAF